MTSNLLCYYYSGMMTPISSMQNVLAVSYLQQVCIFHNVFTSCFHISISCFVITVVFVSCVLCRLDLTCPLVAGSSCRCPSAC